jgi:polysaccharide deacetylase 2 family uncharacterized protein YibQ
LSSAGIPQTKDNKSIDNKANITLKTAVSQKQQKIIEQQLNKYLKNTNCLKIKEFSNGKIIYLETTTDTLKMVLAYKKGEKPKRKTTKKRTGISKAAKQKNTHKSIQKETIKQKFSQPLLAIIIDDVGIGHMDAFKKALTIPYPITFAILPFRQHTNQCAELARGRGYEIILHMPMEPYGYPKKDPGPGAIFEKDNKKLIEEKLKAAFDAVKYAEGLNNHMGSKITALRYSTRVFLNYLKENKYFFIDSRTSKDTIALIEARKLGVPSLKRNVFIDNSRKPKDIEKQLKIAVHDAKKDGFAVAIGHNYPETVNELKKLMPSLDKEINFIFVKDLVDVTTK